jgi:hypothetical protein
MTEAIQGTILSFLYLNEVVHHETMSPHHEVESALGFPDSALAHNENPHPEDID